MMKLGLHFLQPAPINSISPRYSDTKLTVKETFTNHVPTVVADASVGFVRCFFLVSVGPLGTNLALFSPHFEPL